MLKFPDRARQRGRSKKIVEAGAVGAIGVAKKAIECQTGNFSR